jgi:hypothetical protein
MLKLIVPYKLTFPILIVYHEENCRLFTKREARRTIPDRSEYNFLAELLEAYLYVTVHSLDFIDGLLFVK